jgi:uncharacterized membrane protein
MMTRSGIMLAAISAASASVASAATVARPSGVIDAAGRFHPALVHFPIALILAAFVAEMIFIARRDERFTNAARIMLHAGAWVGAAAALTGLARADSISMAPDVAHAFAVHRIAGIAAPVLAFLAAALGDGVRRSGQVWELFLFRIVLALAAVGVIVAGFYGGEIVYGTGFFSLW